MKRTIYGIAVLLLMAFNLGTARNVTVRFSAQVGEELVRCGQRYEGVGAQGTTISFQDFRFYVSNLRLIRSDGQEVAIELEQDGTWQVDNVVLLDFEDATGRCQEGGTPATNDRVRGTVPEGEYTGIAFTLGVPFELNHLDVSVAPAPLNIPGLWWNWQIGYKFARIDMVNEAAANNGMGDGHDGTAPAGFWPFHLGSIGCESPASAIPPQSPCRYPNTVEVRFEAFDPDRDIIVADVLELLDGVDVSQSLEAPPPGCMSGVADPDCAVIMQNVGAWSDTQRFFRVISAE